MQTTPSPFGVEGLPERIYRRNYARCAGTGRVAKQWFEFVIVEWKTATNDWVCGEVLTQFLLVNRRHQLFGQETSRIALQHERDSVGLSRHMHMKQSLHNGATVNILHKQTPISNEVNTAKCNGIGVHFLYSYIGHGLSSMSHVPLSKYWNSVRSFGAPLNGDDATQSSSTEQT